MKMLDFNYKIREKLGKKITQGFEWSGKAFICPTHGFRDEIITKSVGKDIFGFGNEFIEICPECGETCTSKQYNTEEIIKEIMEENN